MSFFSQIKKKFLHRINYTKVFALVGTSGSGKSYSADILVKRYCIDLVIDDGLLIKNNHVLAGVSAKQEKTEMMAVKRAIFFYNKHRSMVINQLDMQFSPRILILGTSKKMVNKICENLFLPLPCKYIRIEDIRTKEEIEYSHRMRDTQGKHIIPISYLELKKFISDHADDVDIDEAFLSKKTLVSPKFSRNLAVTYSDIEMQIVLSGMLQQIDDYLEVIKIVKKNTKNGVDFLLYVHNPFDSAKIYNIDMIKKELNKNLAKNFENMKIVQIELVSSENLERLRRNLKSPEQVKNADYIR